MELNSIIVQIHLPPSLSNFIKTTYDRGLDILPKGVSQAITGRGARPYRKPNLSDGIGAIELAGYVGASGVLRKIGTIATRPDEGIEKYVEAYGKDARVRSAIDLTVCYAVGHAWKFMSDDKELVKRAERLRERLKLDRWSEAALKTMLITGNAYTEIRKDGREDGKLVILPSATMEVNRDEKGNIPKKEAYTQVLPGGKTQPFAYEEIQHMYEPFGSQPKGISRVAAARYALNCLWELEELMLIITDKFAAPLLIARMGDAQNIPDPQALSEMKSKLVQMGKGKNRMWAVPGLIEFQQIESARAALNVEPYLDYFERQVYAALNVPPVLMGKPQGSNRTSANVMMDSFERYIESLQQILEDSIKTILRRFGFGMVPDIVFEEITPEDENARVLRHQRMLGSDRSVGWATIDEVRGLSPELRGTWEEAVSKQSIPEYPEEEGDQTEKRQQPRGKAPEDSEEPPAKPNPKDRGERTSQRPAGERGSQE